MRAFKVDAYVNQVHDKNKGGPAAEKADNTAAKTDTVVISDAAKRIQEARAQLDEIPDVREDKVAELRDQIRNGTYQENPEMTATNLLKEHLFNDQFQK